MVQRRLGEARRGTPRYVTALTDDLEVEGGDPAAPRSEATGPFARSPQRRRRRRGPGPVWEGDELAQLRHDGFRERFPYHEHNDYQMGND